MENTFFTQKDDQYYNMENSWIVSRIPKGSHKILDLGCAAGQLGKKLLGLKKASEVIGVEIFKPAAEEAAKYYTFVHQGDVEGMSLNYDHYFDYVICGDILEHLSDPWTMVAKIYKWLNSEGILICSIPNIRHWQILRDLIIFGKWNYTEAGILDNTHLRFFTRRTFLEMLKNAHFHIEYNDMWISGEKKNMANKATLGFFKEFLGSQVVVVAKKREA
jgi:2-polyprenyl-3-methyl-5-hydroxy-6-metoxy-1,4-benzoquinol methylase